MGSLLHWFIIVSSQNASGAFLLAMYSCFKRYRSPTVPSIQRSPGRAGQFCGGRAEKLAGTAFNREDPMGEVTLGMMF